VPSLPPPPGVLTAFGVPDAPSVPLAGGQGTSWRAGDTVFKPADQSVPELQWLADVYSAVRPEGVRIARQRRSVTGAVCVGGWSATDYVTGLHVSGRWSETIAVSERFHAAMASLTRPAFLDTRDNRWTTADRVAWGEIPADRFGQVPHLPQLAAAIRPVRAHSQLIHGDLGGNVLFDEPRPPALIDFSPYWRPTAYACAIVVADALVWEGADAGILMAVSHIDDFGQFLLRALIFRTVTDWLGGQTDGASGPSQDDPYAPAVNIACQLATDTIS